MGSTVSIILFTILAIVFVILVIGDTINKHKHNKI